MEVAVRHRLVPVEPQAQIRYLAPSHQLVVAGAGALKHPRLRVEMAAQVVGARIAVEAAELVIRLQLLHLKAAMAAALEQTEAAQVAEVPLLRVVARAAPPVAAEAWGSAQP